MRASTGPMAENAPFSPKKFAPVSFQGNSRQRPPSCAEKTARAWLDMLDVTKREMFHDDQVRLLTSCHVFA